MKRFFYRIFVLLIVVVALVVIAGVVVQAVLWTDVPRRVVVRELQETLGLDVQLDALSVGWTGRTVARGVVVTLPLEVDPLFEARALHLRHTGLLSLVLGWGFELRELEAEQARLYARQRADGSWNLDEVQEVLRANLTHEEDEPGVPGLLPLPKLTLTGAEVEITPWLATQPLRLTDLSMVGEAEGALGYHLVMSGPALGRVEAKLSRAAPYQHEVEFDVSPSAALLAIVLDDPDPVALRLRGQWTGQSVASGVAGTLRLLPSQVGPAVVAGEVRVAAPTEGDVRLVLDRPNLRLEVPGLADALPEAMAWRGGRVRLVDGRALAERVQLAAAGGRAIFDGELDLDRAIGQGRLVWAEVDFPQEVIHGGELTLALTRPGPIGRRLEAQVEVRGGSGMGPWRGEATLTAEGPSWQQFTATLVARDLEIQEDEQHYTVDRFAAEVRAEWPRVELTRLDVHSNAEIGRLTGRGGADLQTRAWALSFGGENIHMPGLPTAFTYLNVSLRGDRREIAILPSQVAVQGLEATVQGRYRPGEAVPAVLEVTLEQLPVRVGRDVAPVVWAENISGRLEARGTLHPIALEARGTLTTEALHVRREMLGNVALNVRSDVDINGATLVVDAIEWLGGSWAISGAYDRRSGQARVSIDAEDLDLTLADRLLPQPVGLALGRVDVGLRVMGLAQEHAATVVDGRFAVRDLDWPVPGLAEMPLRMQRLEGRLQLVGGELHVYDVVGEHDQGRLQGSALVALDRPSRVTFDVAFRDWWLPWPAYGVVGWGSGDASGVVDVAERAGRAQMNLRGRAIYSEETIQAYRNEMLAAARAARIEAMGIDGDTVVGAAVRLTEEQELAVARYESSLAELDLAMTLDGSVLSVREMQGALLGGMYEGSVTVPLDRLSESELDVRWEGVMLPRLALAIPPIEQVEGAWIGRLRVARATDRRPLERMRIDLSMDARDVQFRDLPLGRGRATAYFSSERFVLQNLELAALGGNLNLWGRLSHHNGEWFTFASGSANNMDLEVLTAALRPNEPPMVGKVTGEMTLSMPLQQRELMFGNGSVELRQADLGSVPLISLLLDLVNIRVFGTQPDGQGVVRFRIDQGAMVFDEFQYSNRGGYIELYGFRLHDVMQGLDSPLSGYAVLSASLLPELEALDVLNRALRVVQRDVTTVRLFGTPMQPRYRPVPLKGFGEAVGRLVRGAPDDEEEGMSSEYDASQPMQAPVEE